MPSDSTINRDLLRRYDADGMVEIMLGGYLLIAGLLLASHSLLDMLALYLPAGAALLTPIWRRKITFARLGYSDVVEAYEKRWQFWLVIFFFFLPFVLIGVALLLDYLGWVTPGNKGSYSVPMSIAVGCVIALFVAAIGFIRRRPLLYFVALALAALVTLAAINHVRLGYAVAVTGTLLLGMGLLRLNRFCGTHPPIGRDPMPKPDFEAVHTGILSRFKKGGLIQFYIAGLMVFMIVDCACDWNFWVMMIGFLALIASFMLSLEWWRRRVLNRRLGYVKMPLGRVQWSKQTAQMMIFMIPAQLAANWVSKRLCRIHFAGLVDNSDQSDGIRFIVFLGLFFTANALADKAIHEFITAFMFLTLPFVALYFGLSEIYAFSLVAAVSLGFGVIKLKRFLQENPVITEDESANG
jgi:hypothetical protein